MLYDDFNYLKIFFTYLIIWQFAFKISNSALTALIPLLKQLIWYLGEILQLQQLNSMSDGIPLSLKNIRQLLSFHKDDFVTYVVCPSCDSLYEFDDCVERSITGRHEESKYCRHVKFPNHTVASKRSPCNTRLLQKVKCKSGYKLSPIKVYPHKHLKTSIEQLVKRKGFIENCEKWRDRLVPAGYLTDIYDGAVWKRFNSTEMDNFLSLPHCYLLTLNVDWFQPYELGVYTVGAIYLTIQNLPRNERYKTENIILVGVIPGPTEPEKTINSYLKPLIYELNHAWLHGIEVSSNDCIPINVKVALSCVTCDIPASRKVCGFLSHNAAMGCNKCLKKFPVSDRKTCYCGFDEEEWTLRTLEQHVIDVEEINKENTKTGRKKAESKYGIRYSVLVDLPYFDPTDFTAIDSMHNLYLGSGKHMFNIWMDTELLTKQKLAKIEARIKQFNTPCDVGRLPAHMSCYKSFTANQWKNWITLYSCVLLKDLLPPDDFRCRKCFVRSCVIISSYSIRESDIRTAHLFLGQFCRQFERLYGKESCTFNMHLHLHLKKILLDFGPAHASWCYAFERYNGILGSYFTNNRSIEPQIMQRFSEHQAIYSEDIAFEQFKSILPHNQQQEDRSRTISNSFFLLHYSNDPLETIETFAWIKDMNAVLPLPPYFEEVFSTEEADQLSNLYHQLYLNQGITPSEILVTHYKFGRVLFAGDLIGSNMPGRNSNSSAVVMAYWPNRVEDLSTIDYSTMQVGVVQYFSRHKFCYSISGNHEEEVHIFACVKWKRLHAHFDWFGSSAIVCESIDEIEFTNFMPVQRIACRCAYISMPVDFHDITETVFIACPITMKYCV